MKYKMMFFLLLFSLFLYYDTIICIIAIISIIAFNDTLKWQLFLMMMMIVVSAIPTRKSDSLTAHKHLHRRSNTSPLDRRFSWIFGRGPRWYFHVMPYAYCIHYINFFIIFHCTTGTSSHRAHIGGRRGQHVRFDALDYHKIRQGNAGKLGTYDILSVLPDKFTRFLFEFHSHRFESLDLPFLPADRRCARSTTGW